MAGREEGGGGEEVFGELVHAARGGGGGKVCDCHGGGEGLRRCCGERR